VQCLLFKGPRLVVDVDRGGDPGVRWVLLFAGLTMLVVSSTVLYRSIGRMVR
jgi:hypothetical protein